MAVDLNVLGSPLRSLHTAMAEQLGQTFGEPFVRAHSAEVDASTVQRYVQGAIALWPVIASGKGVGASGELELKLDVQWGVFVIASASFESSGDAHSPVTAVQVAETLANLVARLAYNSRWGLAPGECTQCSATSIDVRNLGVGLKTTKAAIESEDLGLFVVWGRNTLTLGEALFPGGEPLPLLEALAGAIEENGPEDEAPAIPLLEDIEQAFSALWEAVVGAWRRLGRSLRGPSWPELAELVAAQINAEMASVQADL